MNKCTKCGTEFEGNFCPKCGASATEDVTCPKCGKKLQPGVNFCTWCGQSFGSLPEPQKSGKIKTQSSEFTEKLYGILKCVPAIAFTLFSALLFLFFIAPVAVVPAIGESYGSVYTIINEEPEFKGEAIALLIFAALSLLCVALVWAVRLSAYKFRRFKIFGKELKFTELVEFSSFVFYFIFFLMGCIICGKVASLDGGMGLMSAGAAPVLVLVFSIIFAIVGAGALIARYFLKKNFTYFAQKEEEIEKAQFAGYKAHLEELVNAGAPVEPQKVEKPKPPVQAVKIVNGKIRAEVFALFFVAIASVVFTFAIIILDSVLYEEEYANWYLNVYVLSGSAAALLAVAIISAFIRVKKVKSQKVCKKGFVIFTAVISICTIFAFSIYLAVYGISEILPPHESYFGESSLYAVICCLIASGLIALCGIISFIWSTVVACKIKKIQKNEEAFGELNGQLELYNKNKSDYAVYLKEYSVYKNQCKKYRHTVKVYEKVNRKFKCS